MWYFRIALNIFLLINILQKKVSNLENIRTSIKSRICGLLSNNERSKSGLLVILCIIGLSINWRSCAGSLIIFTINKSTKKKQQLNSYEHYPKKTSKFTPAEYRRSFWKKKRSNLKWLYNETLSIHNSFLEKSHLVSYEFLLENNLNWILFTLSTVTYLDMLFRINKQKNK